MRMQTSSRRSWRPFSPAAGHCSPQVWARRGWRTAASVCAAAVLADGWRRSRARLSATQTVVTSAADAGTADYAALDLALRGLAVLISADPDGRLPDVVAARLDGGRLELRLHDPADRPPPEPWTADDTGLWWFLRLDQDTGVAPEVARARLAPYPTLVTIGTDSAGRWLLDLERLGAVYVTGPADRRDGLRPAPGRRTGRQQLVGPAHRHHRRLRRRTARPGTAPGPPDRHRH